MRFDLEALRQAFAQVASWVASFSLSKMVAAGGVALATLVVIYGALLGAVVDNSVDAVSVNAPVFTPVALTPPRPAPAVKPSGRDANAAPRFEDAVSVTRAVQAELKRAGCYSGPINGVWTPSTRAAMGEFTARVNARLPVDRADPVLLALLETHNKITCSDEADAPPRAPKAEVASVEEAGATASMRDSPTPPISGAAPSHGAEDLGYSAGSQRAPNPIAAVQESAEPDGETLDETAVVPAAVPAPQRATNPEPRRAARKYKKQPSLSRQVSKSFKSLQRSLNKLF
jgi:hypothetical protein